MKAILALCGFVAGAMFSGCTVIDADDDEQLRPLRTSTTTTATTQRRVVETPTTVTEIETARSSRY